ncbi:MAG: hypothetical protein HY716_18235 [Planctomycetes bacterium]|nr:hypothetical protein [Planctomycetota bacterium]
MISCFKLGALIVTGAGVLALLVILASGARARGKLTYCRNNLRFLGQLAHQQLPSGVDESGAEVHLTGRAFWQAVRRDHFTRSNPRLGKREWIVRFGGMNPFGCPVRGAQPLDLSRLKPSELEAHMSDPETIDYLGPRRPIEAPPPGFLILGADRRGNHPRGGHILRVDLSIDDLRDAVNVQEWVAAPDADASVAD